MLFPVWVLGVLPLPAIVVGGLVAHAHGVSAKAFGVNVVAAVLGLALVAVLARRSWESVIRRALAIAITIALLLATTCLFPDLEGVSRWIALGPVRLNASAVTMPWLLLAVAGLLSQGRPALALVVIAVTQVLHVLQPDAGQATAFGVGAAVLIGATRTLATGWRGVGCALAVMGAAGAWLRPDPLGAVPHVERILHMAADRGAPWLVAALVTLGVLVLPAAYGAMWLRSVRSEAAPLAAAFALYFGATLVVTELGNFPVPVLGAGAGPVLGWYSLLGVLQLAVQGAPRAAKQDPAT
jgi:hypothetical protein